MNYALAIALYFIDTRIAKVDGSEGHTRYELPFKLFPLFLKMS
jgi:hypothetical protein